MSHTSPRAASQTAPKIIVAIDGPAGAGKSTLARSLAARFGLLNLETGAMYRAFALKALASGAATNDAEALERLASATSILLQPTSGGNRVLLDAVEVTDRLRTPEVTRAASEVSVHPAIRRWMVAQQRTLGESGGVVMEGRDIGTAVFPYAQVKIFLDASSEARGERRFEQVRDAAASAAQPAAITAEMRERDRRDRTRADSPLRPASDAVIIDSTKLTLNEVIARATAVVENHLRSVEA